MFCVICIFTSQLQALVRTYASNKKVKNHLKNETKLVNYINNDSVSMWLQGSTRIGRLITSLRCCTCGIAFCHQLTSITFLAFVHCWFVCYKLHQFSQASFRWERANQNLCREGCEFLWFVRALKSANYQCDSFVYLWYMTDCGAQYSL